MPTIEIISINRYKPIDVRNKDLPFYIRQNNRPVSHRGVFERKLWKMDGVILHLGNKEFGRTGFFCGSDLINWYFSDNKDMLSSADRKRASGSLKLFRFQDDMFPAIIQVIKKAKRLSPINRCIFLTDIQWATQRGIVYGEIPLTSFIEKQTESYYLWNTWYEIT
jgi:hypothetical protein